MYIPIFFKESEACKALGDQVLFQKRLATLLENKRGVTAKARRSQAEALLDTLTDLYRNEINTYYRLLRITRKPYFSCFEFALKMVGGPANIKILVEASSAYELERKALKIARTKGFRLALVSRRKIQTALSA